MTTPVNSYRTVGNPITSILAPYFKLESGASTADLFTNLFNWATSTIEGRVTGGMQGLPVRGVQFFMTVVSHVIDKLDPANPLRMAHERVQGQNDEAERQRYARAFVGHLVLGAAAVFLAEQRVAHLEAEMVQARVAEGAALETLVPDEILLNLSEMIRGVSASLPKGLPQVVGEFLTAVEAETVERILPKRMGLLRDCLTIAQRCSDPRRARMIQQVIPLLIKAVVEQRNWDCFKDIDWVALGAEADTLFRGLANEISSLTGKERFKALTACRALPQKLRQTEGETAMAERFEIILLEVIS